METAIDHLYDLVRNSLISLGLEFDPIIRQPSDLEFGDYQSNCAMALAKRLNKKPYEVAELIASNIAENHMFDAPSVIGGYINFKLKTQWAEQQLQVIAQQPDKLGVSIEEKPQTIVVDLSSPNLAKEMHIGHLRSTVIGDCIANILEFAGHHVIRENHIGDWGTQFGMLIAYLQKTNQKIDHCPTIHDLESFYIAAKNLFDSDEDFKKESQMAVVALQSRDPAIQKIWKTFCDESLRHCHAIYDRLGVSLIDRGESFYVDIMKEVISHIERKINGSNIRVSDGSLCVFLEGYKTPEGEPLPLILQKLDGATNYATSDLAAILHRTRNLGAKRIVYVVGSSQNQHLEMVFKAAKITNLVGCNIELQHIGFGNVLRKNGKPFKTREGNTIKLADALDEAVQRAKKLITEDSQLDVEKTSNTVAMAAIKYFDLSHSLNSDYRFDPDVMLSMDGNTGPYILYAYTRIASIIRKSNIQPRQDTNIKLDHPAELSLGKKLIQFSEVMKAVINSLRPNLLTNYLYDLAKTFNKFYDKTTGVKVIDSSLPIETSESRLQLCSITAMTLKLGLKILGIHTLEKM